MFQHDLHPINRVACNGRDTVADRLRWTMQAIRERQSVQEHGKNAEAHDADHEAETH